LLQYEKEATKTDIYQKLSSDWDLLRCCGPLYKRQQLIPEGSPLTLQEH